MTKINVKLTPKAKKWVFIGIVIIALIFVATRFQRSSEFRVAKKAFNNGDYVQAAELFSELGTYSDSDFYVVYCQALTAFSEEDYETASELFASLGTFQKSSRYLLYTKGMIAYQNSQYWEAASLFEECGESMFGHSAFLDNEIKAKMCYYTCGKLLEMAGDFQRAITCYRLADDFEDAEVRLQECENALQNGGATSYTYVN